MRSWSNWETLNKSNVGAVLRNAQGVYAIRMASPPQDAESDIIYIGASGTGNQGVGKRLDRLLTGLGIVDEKRAKDYHSAAPRIRKYESHGLEFSWLECSRNPDGVEKALLIGFCVSASRLPICNTKL